MQSPVPALTRALDVTSGLLTKAEAHCTAQSIAPEAILAFRLFPDMFTFTRQVQLTCDFAVRCALRLSQGEVPSIPDTETSFAQLQARVASARALIADLAASAFEGAEERTIVLQMRSGERQMSGADYLTGFITPQIYFHLTTAYNILRHNGVAVGKLDYMGVR